MALPEESTNALTAGPFGKIVPKLKKLEQAGPVKL